MPGTGITESWAEAYRRRKGIDQWPLVEATVIGREIISGDEGPDSYKLTFRYKPPSGPASDSYWSHSLTVNHGTTLASAYPDDIVTIHCHPEDPEKIAQADATQLAYNIRSLIILSLFALVFLYLLISGHVHWGGDD